MALSELPDRATYLEAARQKIAALLPADDVFWMESDFAARTSSVWHGPAGRYDATLGGQMGRAGDHPVIAGYRAAPADLAPRRISDVITASRWQRTAAHDVLHTAVGRHQLSVVVRVTRPMQGHAWVIGRGTTDFTSGELAFSVALQPLLTALDRMYLRCVPIPAAETDRIAQARERAHLSDREVDILTLVAAGLKAEAIARVRRISIPTVRKHLQNIYTKLGCSERLLAVDHARRLGILPGSPTHLARPEPYSAARCSVAQISTSAAPIAYAGGVHAAGRHDNQRRVHCGHGQGRRVRDGE